MSAPTSICLNIGALQITLSLPLGTVLPANGYKIKYRPVGTLDWTYAPNQNQNNISITNVPLCTGIEGTIQSDCGDGNYGIEYAFYAPAPPLPCKTYRLTGANLSYTFYMCGQSVPTTITNSGPLASNGMVICAVEGTITGGTFEDTGIACNV